MRMSLTMTSGSSSSARAISSSYPPATPTTSKSSAVPMRARRPSRTIRLSSARSTEILGIGLIGLGRPNPDKVASTTRAVRVRTPKDASPHHRPRAITPLGCGTEVMNMRYKSSVTAASWIPAEAVRGFLGVPFEMGLAHHDDPLPERLDDLEAWHAKDL